MDGCNRRIDSVGRRMFYKAQVFYNLWYIGLTAKFQFDEQLLVIVVGAGTHDSPQIRRNGSE